MRVPLAHSPPVDSFVHSVSSRARSGLSLAAETEQEVLEPGQVLLALGGRLGPRVLQVDEGADPFPRRALGERVGQLGLEGLFVVPAGVVDGEFEESNEPAERQFRGLTYLFCAIAFSFLAL